MNSFSRLNNSFYNFHFPFRTFTLSVFIIAIIPSLIQDGMFIDGIQYAAVSKNLAHHLGTFWFPYLSENWNLKGSIFFLEHPPLVYAIQSIFFRILGDGIYTERVYCLFTAGISAFLILKIWNLVTKNDPEIQNMSWLPVLLWIMTPIAFRSYQINVQENTMGVFILAAVYLILKGLNMHRYSYFYMVFAGVFVFLSSLCKGIPGLFPIVAVLMYWLAGGKIKFTKMLIFSLVLFSVPAFLYSLFLLNDNANASLSFYFTERLLDRVQSEPVVNSHLHIIFRLLIDLIPVIFVCFTAFLAGRKKTNLRDIKKYKRYVFFFLLVGAAGSVPLSFTLVQRDFYLSPSLPFFAIGLALLSSPFLNTILKRFSQNTTGLMLFRTISILLLIGGLVYTGMKAGKAERDQDILHDMYILGKEIGEGSRVHIATSSGDYWSLELYLIRHFNISLDFSSKEYEYLIRGKSDEPQFQELYKLIPLQTRTYSLYKRLD